MEAIGGSRGLILGLWAPGKAWDPSALGPVAPGGRELPGLGTGGAAPARRGCPPRWCSVLASCCVNYSRLLIIPWRQRHYEASGAPSSAAAFRCSLDFIYSPFYRAAIIAAHVFACEWVNRLWTLALANYSHLSVVPVQPLSSR